VSYAAVFDVDAEDR